MSGGSRPELPRADRVVPGVWRLRLPLPWTASPHGNAYAVSAGDGVVLFDTGYGGPKGLHNLELALELAGFRLADVRLVACTHAHSDHYGAAASIVERTRCQLWIHRAWEHVRMAATDPEAALERRLALARREGAPAELVEGMRAAANPGAGFDGVIPPDRELRTGVEVETDLGPWRAHETPGHAPSHVVFHQPESRILLSGDLIVGRVFLYFDYGHTPDPVGEFLSSLDAIARLDVGLCISGHGKPFRAVPAKIEANRAEVARRLEDVRDALGERPATAFELASGSLGSASMDPAILGYALEMTLAFLTHLERLGQASAVSDSDHRAWTRASP